MKNEIYHLDMNPLSKYRQSKMMRFLHLFLAVIFLQLWKGFAESTNITCETAWKTTFSGETTFTAIWDAEIEQCGQRPVDVIFILDGSRSVRPGNFKIVKDYVKNFTYIFDEIGPRDAQIGVIQFASSVREEIRLNEYDNRQDLFEAIDNIHYMEMGTMTGEALKYLITVALNQSHGSRIGQSDVHSIVLVITDGKSQDYHRGTLTKWQKEGKKLGIEFYSIGVGRRYNQRELLEIASTPKDEHTFHASDFNGIQSIALQLRDLEICSLAFPGPENLQLENITHTRVNIHWEIPGQVNPKLISHYTLSYKDVGGNMTMHRLEVNESTSAILSNLKPSTTYIVFVSAVSQNSSSESRPIQGSFTTLSVARTNVTLSEPTLSTLSVRWTAAGGDRLTGYELSYMAVNQRNKTANASGINLKKNTQYFDSNATTTILRDLEPNTTYTVSVKSLHGHVSGEANFAEMKTDSFMPPNVIIFNSSLSDLILKWRGVQRYSVSYWKITIYDAKTGNLLQNFNCSGNLTRFIIKHLPWSSRCKVSVVGVVEKDGRYFKTPPTIIFGKTKSLRPPNVEVVQTTATKIQLWWSKINSKAVTWILKIYPKRRKKQYKIAKIPGERNSTIVGGFIPSTQYKVEVFAKVMKDGELLTSPRGKARTVTKSLQAPNATITSTSSSSMEVEWENIPTPVDSWRIRIRNVINDQWVQVKNVDKATNRAIFHNLTSNTSYAIFVCGRVQRRKLTRLSPETVVYGTTDVLIPLVARCTDVAATNITISWNKAVEATSWSISAYPENQLDHEVTLNGNILSYQFIQLEPATVYTITVKGNIETHGSTSSIGPSTTDTCTTKPNPPSNLRIDDRDSNHLTMVFDPPDGSIDGYFGYCTSFYNPQMVVIATFTNDSTVLCQGLQQASLYSIYLSSVYRNTSSDEISTFGYTLTLPPTGLTLSNVTTHSLVATWTASAGEEIEFYFVTYNSSEHEAEMVVVQGNTTTTTLKYLEPDTLYFVQVQAEVNGQQSPAEESSKKTLSEILDLRIDDVGYTSINVSWTPSSVPHLKSYCLKYTPAYLPTYDDSLLLPPNVLNYSLTNLETATIYKIALNAQYLVKQSEEIEKFASTLALPPIGPINFTEITESSFVARWDPPETNPFPVRYIVTYYKSERAAVSIEGVNTTFILFDKLKAATVYTVRVQACYPDDLVSQPIEGQVTTLTSALSSCSCSNYLRTQSRMQEQIEKMINQISSLNNRFDDFQRRDHDNINSPTSRRFT